MRRARRITSILLGCSIVISENAIAGSIDLKGVDVTNEKLLVFLNSKKIEIRYQNLSSCMKLGASIVNKDGLFLMGREPFSNKKKVLGKDVASELQNGYDLYPVVLARSNFSEYIWTVNISDLSRVLDDGKALVAGNSNWFVYKTKTIGETKVIEVEGNELHDYLKNGYSLYLGCDWK